MVALHTHMQTHIRHMHMKMQHNTLLFTCTFYEHKLTHMHAHIPSWAVLYYYVIASPQETGFKRNGKEVKVLKVIIS